MHFAPLIILSVCSSQVSVFVCVFGLAWLRKLVLLFASVAMCANVSKTSMNIFLATRCCCRFSLLFPCILIDFFLFRIFYKLQWNGRNKIENSQRTLGCTSIHFSITFFSISLFTSLVYFSYCHSFTVLLRSKNHTFDSHRQIFCQLTQVTQTTLQTIKNNNNIIINQARCSFRLSATNLMNFTMIFFFSPLILWMHACAVDFLLFSNNYLLKRWSQHSCSLFIRSDSMLFSTLWMHFK